MESCPTCFAVVTDLEAHLSAAHDEETSEAQIVADWLDRVDPDELEKAVLTGATMSTNAVHATLATLQALARQS